MKKAIKIIVCIIAGLAVLYTAFIMSLGAVTSKLDDIEDFKI